MVPPGKNAHRAVHSFPATIQVRLCTLCTHHYDILVYLPLENHFFHISSNGQATCCFCLYFIYCYAWCIFYTNEAIICYIEYAEVGYYLLYAMHPSKWQ